MKTNTTLRLIVQGQETYQGRPYLTVLEIMEIEDSANARRRLRELARRQQPTWEVPATKATIEILELDEYRDQQMVGTEDVTQWVA